MPDIFDLTSALDQRGDSWPFDSFSGTTEVVELNYQSPEPHETPYLLVPVSYTNDSDSQDQFRINDTKRTTATMSWSIQRGIQLSLKESVKITFPSKLEWGQDASMQVTINQTEGGSVSEEQTWTWDQTVQVQPRKRLEVEVIIDELEMSTPFKAKTVFSGKVTYLLIGFGAPDKTKTFGIGELFTAYPDQQVTVLSPDSISLPVAGRLEARRGRRYRIEKHVFDLDKPEAA
ncbi:ETX/MTX2 family pore-forming toxin [Paraburkholderia sediminicola]|uniref:ETX/MTX2 family pore-forming toxin n=1 Tax=Paraburkholderia sediminicola TaxID=458836 RepID=UPI0038B8B2C8